MNSSKIIIMNMNDKFFLRLVGVFLLISPELYRTIEVTKQRRGGNMADEYGSDYITIVDEDGTEFELEVLTTLDYNGQTYLAVILADGEEHASTDVSILKSVEEDGEPILCAIEDDAELEAVYSLMMESLYDDEEESE